MRFLLVGLFEEDAMRDARQIRTQVDGHLDSFRVAKVVSRMADGEVSKPTARTKELTARFGLAVAFANQLHRRQIRKGSGIPYMSHLLGVASLALEHGANEDEAIAAVLHDAVEDQGGEPTLETIRRTFGEKVAEIVDECTDAVVIPKPDWEPRKRAYIAGLAKASKGALLVSAADKLHDVRSMLGTIARSERRSGRGSRAARMGRSGTTAR